MFYKKSHWLKNAYMQSSIQEDESWIEMSDDLFQQDLSLGDFYLKTFLANPDDCYLTYHKLYNLQQQQMQLQKYLNDTDYIITKLNELKLTETEEDFNETLDVVEKCKYDSAFTFIYSPRENTPAAKMNDPIPLSVKQERLQRLNEIVNKYALINNEKLVGQVVPVLIEGESQKGNGLYAGYTDTMKLTNVKCDKEDIGKIINVKITEAKTWSLNGEKE